MRNLKKILALVLALVMSMSLVSIASATKFSDDADIEYQEAVDVMTALEVIDGVGGNRFNPTGTLTREQAATIICRMLLGPDGAEKLSVDRAPFSDVAQNRWSAPYIAYCVEQGIIDGVGGNRFNPQGTLTGYAFAKMVLCALGYDAAIQTYTGSQWSINVAKDAVTAGIDVDGLLMSNGISREQAAQMAFQALEADLVYYTNKGTNITLDDGTTIVTGASDPTKIDYSASKDYRTTDTDAYQQFCEKYFSKLALDNADTDSFGRPAHTWSNGKDDIGTYRENDEAEFVYTADTKDATVKSNLKGYDYAKGLTATVNSDEGATIASYSDVADLTADGTIVEVYATDKEIDSVIVIETDYAEVTAVNDNKETFTVKYNSGKTEVIDEDSDFYSLYGNVEKDDILVVSYASDNTILDLYIPETVNGDITYVKTNGKQATVAGETVKAAATAGALFNGTLGQDSVVYLNESGYAVYVDAATTSDAQYMYVTNMWADEDDGYGGSDKTYYAKGVMADGTIETIEIANSKDTGSIDASEFGMSSSLAYGTAAGNAAKFTNGNKTPAVYQYTESESEGGLYLLTVPETGSTSQEGVIKVAGSSSSNLSSNDSKIGSVYMSSDVSFVWVSGNGDNVKASVTGKAAIGKNIDYYAVIEEDTATRNLATVVFVASNSATSEDVIYVSEVQGNVKFEDADGKTKTGKQVEYYAFGDTEPSTMIVSGSASVGFFTTETDGEAYKLNEAADGNKKVEQVISSMYNGYATVTEEYNFNDAVIIDTTDNGIDTVEALEDAVNTEDQTVKVSFTYSGSDNEVETVYVQSVKSTDTEIDTIILSNGDERVEATVDNGAHTAAATVTKASTKYEISVETSDTNASVTAGFEVTSAADGSTQNVTITVKADDGSTQNYTLTVTTEVPDEEP